MSHPSLRLSKGSRKRPTSVAIGETLESRLVMSASAATLAGSVAHAHDISLFAQPMLDNTATRFAVSLLPKTGVGQFGYSWIKVTALDASGHVAEGYKGTVHFSSKDLPNVTDDAPLINGKGSFPILLPAFSANVYQITVTDVANPSLTGSSPIALDDLERGVVFLDVNANGILDAGESPLPDRTVFLDINGNGSFDSGDAGAATDINGVYSFPGIGPGEYPVAESPNFDSSYLHAVDIKTGQPDGTTRFGVVPFSSVAPVPVVPNPFTPTPAADANAAFVASLYRAVLGRDGAAPEIDAWVGGLSRDLTRPALVSAFVNSFEHRRQQVDSYYRTYLNRDADLSSQGWVNALMSGTSEETVAAAILSSPEYRSKTYDNDSLVRSLYRDVLGRDADGIGLANATAALDQGAKPATLVAGLIHSTEAIDQILDGYYSAYLRRRRDPSSAGWASILTTPGGSASSVAIGILASDEFFARASQPAT